MSLESKAKTLTEIENCNNPLHAKIMMDIMKDLGWEPEKKWVPLEAAQKEIEELKEKFATIDNEVLKMVACMLSNCRYNSLRKEVGNFKEGVCETDILIRDKGWGPQCRGYDEMKECFGDVDLSDEICLKCEDLTDCANLAIKKAAQKEGKKHEKAQET